MSAFIDDTKLENLSYLEIIPYLENKLKFDSTTYYHSLNVACLCCLLLHKLDYPASNNLLLYYGGLFHDIGKTIVPTGILGKDHPLAIHEFDQIKEHPKLGFKILQKNNFPPEILFAALFHHEKYDGSGYPMGFEREEIPMIARIVNVCDVFDALTSDRPYRKAYSINKALHIMADSEGQFDPNIFSTLYQIIK